MEINIFIQINRLRFLPALHVYEELVDFLIGTNPQQTDQTKNYVLH